MLLKQQYESRAICRESEAFAATCVVFKIKLAELAYASGLDLGTIEKFRQGDGGISTTTLFKILKVLTPNERNFYNALINIQNAASDGEITLPLLDFAPSVKADVYRDALELTFRVFGINSRDVYSAAGMQSSNFSNWLTGKRDITLPTLARIKAALSKPQRAFFESVADIYVCLEPHPPANRPVSILANNNGNMTANAA
jgi:transcriptional regulator with XRE-family HTH domain